jgi:hypothetical protein
MAKIMLRIAQYASAVIDLDQRTSMPANVRSAEHRLPPLCIECNGGGSGAMPGN